MDIDIDLLLDIRSSPRKMHKSYLDKCGLLSTINLLVPEDYKMKEKIDIILKGTYDRCYCGRLSKPNTRWCSISCMNKDVDMRENVSIKNTENSKDRLRKAEQTRIDRYGVRSVQDIPSSKTKTRESKQKYYDKWIDDTFDRYNLSRDSLSDHEYLKSICDCSCLFDVMREHFNGMPYTTLIRHFRRIGFNPEFKKGSTSMGEHEMYTWLSSITNCDILRNDRKAIGKELDIYIPDKKLAIEFNGIYWHSEKIFESKGINAKNYHRLKTDLCNKHGIQLLQFFEDEWLYKKDIVKSIISSKLGFHNRYFARKLTVGSVGDHEKKLFLQENHLQGNCVGSCVGLYNADNLICILVYGKSRFEDGYEILRFASKKYTQVIGGLSRLVKYAKLNLGVQKLITYADLRYSNGKSYDNIGEYIKTTEVGYFWVHSNNGTRINRFSTQKHKLIKMFPGVDLNKTENQIMEDNGYLKIFDCGNLKYLV